MKRLAPLVAALGLVCALVSPGLAQEGDGFPPGLWRVRIFAPVLAPAMENEEQSYELCYSAADSKDLINPVLPRAEAPQCAKDFMDLGDIAFDATCPDGDHRLRITEITKDLWRGTYRFVARDSDLILEPAVELKRIAATCK